MCSIEIFNAFIENFNSPYSGDPYTIGKPDYLKSKGKLKPWCQPFENRIIQNPEIFVGISDPIQNPDHLNLISF